MSVGIFKYWLRVRGGKRNGGKILVFINFWYSIFKENYVRLLVKVVVFVFFVVIVFVIMVSYYLLVDFLLMFIICKSGCIVVWLYLRRFVILVMN